MLAWSGTPTDPFFVSTTPRGMVDPSRFSCAICSSSVSGSNLSETATRKRRPGPGVPFEGEMDLTRGEQADQATATLEWDEEKCMRFSTRIPRLNFMEPITVMFRAPPESIVA